MTLPPGARLGPYEILSPLGAGGMGEVYRARDTQLKPDVAVKLISDALARDPEHLARCEREAQMLAALNHSRIARSARIDDPVWSSDGRSVLFVGTCLVSLLLLGLPLAAAPGRSTAPWPTKAWPESTPEAEGLDRAALADLDSELAAGKQGYVDSMLVI
ncbi:MAG: hypothetical protein ABI968_12875, partial [Acidobacteriota bacterium]